MKRWVIRGAALTAVVAAAVGIALAVANNDGPVTSIDDIDRGECSAVHNIGACERQAVALAKEDLAARLGISESEITVSSSEFTQWPDTSLGNPQPGMAYAQVITPGFKIFLAAGGQEYEYHSDLGDTVTLVE